MRVLCTGDIHIGRRSSRLPEHVEGRILSCGECWGRIVDLAIQERVEVVALSGDVVDRANRFYEATGPLEAGIRKLAGSGITTVAVAGNHDFDVFPRLAESFDAQHFRFVGRGGEWERTTIRRGEASLNVVGWSFPEGHVRESPLASLAMGPAEDGPVLGLLHADLDQPGSPYAPVTLAELRAAPVDAWLLGHVHAPRLEEAAGAPPVLYPGSPQAMDPGETGDHGVWILDVTPGRPFRGRQVSLSTVRYDTLEVDVTGVDGLLAFDQRVTDAVRTHLRDVAPASGSLRYLSCRIRVVGRTTLHRELAARLEDLRQDLELEEDGVTALVERAEALTRPAIDLEELARARDAAGIVARLILALDGAGTGEPRTRANGAAGGAGVLPDAIAGGEEPWASSPAQDARDSDDDAVARLLREATSRVGDVYRARPYLRLRDDQEDPAGVATAALRRQASVLLDELLAQKESA